ncbi:MAG TPA: hypothetical protein VGD59_12085 [Acidisarcina sp.]
MSADSRQSWKRVVDFVSFQCASGETTEAFINAFHIGRFSARSKHVLVKLLSRQGSVPVGLAKDVRHLFCDLFEPVSLVAHAVSLSVMSFGIEESSGNYGCSVMPSTQLHLAIANVMLNNAVFDGARPAISEKILHKHQGQLRMPRFTFLGFRNRTDRFTILKEQTFRLRSRLSRRIRLQLEYSHVLQALSASFNPPIQIAWHVPRIANVRIAINAMRIISRPFPSASTCPTDHATDETP